MLTRLYNYVRVSRVKMVVWGCFLFPFILTLVLSSVLMPRWVRQLVYQASVRLERLVPTTTSRATPATQPGVAVVFDQLAFTYILLTYLWSCILVETFATIRGSTRRDKRTRARAKA